VTEPLLVGCNFVSGICKLKPKKKPLKNLKDFTSHALHFSSTFWQCERVAFDCNDVVKSRWHQRPVTIFIKP